VAAAACSKYSWKGLPRINSGAQPYEASTKHCEWHIGGTIRSRLQITQSALVMKTRITEHEETLWVLHQNSPTNEIIENASNHDALANERDGTDGCSLNPPPCATMLT